MMILEQNGVQFGLQCKGYELVLFVSFLLVSVNKYSTDCYLTNILSKLIYIQKSKAVIQM